jgi:hypothetical protein
MKLSLRNLFAAAGVLVATAAGGRAEEISLAPKFEPFAAPEITLVGHCTDGCADGCNNGCNNGCGSCCDSCCNSCCTSRHVGRDFWTCNDRCGGLVGGFEFLYLEPFAEDGLAGPAAIGGINVGNPDIDLEPAYRIWGGWENRDGLGARVRYFQIDGDDAGVATAVAIEYRYIDAELTQAVAFRRSSMQFAAGARYAEAQNAFAIPGVLGLANEFQGYGLTFAVQANRDISRAGALRMTANARWSLLYGENDIGVALPVLAVVPTATIEDEIMQIIELQVGPQLRIPLRSGGYLTAFGGVEAQYWQNGVSTVVPGLSIDTGFLGLATSVGITR